ncbi:MAG: shikimate kinase [Alistipes putredinis]|nr:MAG: shikimate kinase [Alistipes putredinis]
MVVFLIGYMGCGKSSLGRRIAARVGYEFIDMDKIIEQKCSASVSEIFATRGEKWFREMERRTLEELAGLTADTIVATGGGVPCFSDNMQLMNSMGKTVYLKMSPQKIVGRISPAGRQKRPIIRGMDDEQLLDFISRNLPAREPYYESSSLIVDCDTLSDAAIMEHIIHEIKR